MRLRASRSSSIPACLRGVFLDGLLQFDLGLGGAGVWGIFKNGADGGLDVYAMMGGVVQQHKRVLNGFAAPKRGGFGGGFGVGSGPGM